MYGAMETHVTHQIEQLPMNKTYEQSFNTSNYFQLDSIASKKQIVRIQLKFEEINFE